MFKPLKNALTATMLSAVAITPVATVSFIATADVAVAKGKKDKGGKKERSSRDRKAKSAKSAKLQKSKGNKPQWIAKGGSKKSASGGGGGAKMAKAKKTVGDTGMHPSELGNMNGALNANENAILAHIRNGNTSNGPVGHMAALAIAGYDRDAATELLDTPTAQEYGAVDDALAAQLDENGDPLFESYEDYQTYLDEGGDPINEVDEAVANIGQSAVDDAVAESDYASLEEYLQAKEDSAADAEPAFDANIEMALSATGEYDQGTADSFSDANGAIEDYDSAMADMIDYWNKGDAESGDAEALQTMLEERLDSYEGVGDTIEEQRASEDAVDGDETCADGDLDCGDETALLDE